MAKFPFVKFINFQRNRSIPATRTAENTIQKSSKYHKLGEKERKMYFHSTQHSSGQNVKKLLAAAERRANWIKTKLRIFPFYLFGSVGRFLLSTLSKLQNSTPNFHFVQLRSEKGLTMMLNDGTQKLRLWKHRKKSADRVKWKTRESRAARKGNWMCINYVWATPSFGVCAVAAAVLSSAFHFFFNFDANFSSCQIRVEGSKGTHPL